MSELKNIPCAGRGFHYYRRYWTPYLREELICQHDDSNPFDVFPIKTCSQESGGTYGHLPKEISRATKFLIDRGCSSVRRGIIKPLPSFSTSSRWP